MLDSSSWTGSKILNLKTGVQTTYRVPGADAKQIGAATWGTSRAVLQNLNVRQEPSVTLTGLKLKINTIYYIVLYKLIIRSYK